MTPSEERAVGGIYPRVGGDLKKSPRKAEGLRGICLRYHYRSKNYRAESFFSKKLSFFVFLLQFWR